MTKTSGVISVPAQAVLRLSEAGGKDLLHGYLSNLLVIEVAGDLLPFMTATTDDTARKGDDPLLVNWTLSGGEPN